MQEMMYPNAGGVLRQQLRKNTIISNNIGSGMLSMRGVVALSYK